MSEFNPCFTLGESVLFRVDDSRNTTKFNAS